MEFYNPDNGIYFLSLNVLKDMDSRTIFYYLDQKSMEFPISNQGYYMIFLDQFSFCKIEDSQDIKITLRRWNKSFLEAIQGCKNSLLEIGRASCRERV